MAQYTNYTTPVLNYINIRLKETNENIKRIVNLIDNAKDTDDDIKALYQFKSQQKALVYFGKEFYESTDYKCKDFILKPNYKGKGHEGYQYKKMINFIDNELTISRLHKSVILEKYNDTLKKIKTKIQEVQK